MEYHVDDATPSIQPGTIFHQKTCVPPMINLQARIKPHTSTLRLSTVLDDDITQQDVIIELVLPKVSNGKAVGGAGWPAELLGYAAHYVIMDDGSRHKVWVLAPLLNHLLNYCCHAGALPPCISLALAIVKPIHKKSCTQELLASRGRALLPALHDYIQQKVCGAV